MFFTKRSIKVAVGKNIYYIPRDMAFSYVDGDYYEKNFIYWFTKAVEKVKHPVIYDVGANFGYYSVKYAQDAKIIYSFEPVDSTYKSLVKNIKINKINNVLPLRIGLLDVAGADYMNLYSSSGNNSVYKRKLPKNHHVKHTGREKIKIETIDRLVESGGIKPPDIIKIDTEGGELNIIKGAKGTLEKYKPTLIMEFSENIFKDAGYTKKDLASFLSKLKYKLYGLDEDVTKLNLSNKIFSKSVANIIAIHKERANKYEW